MDLLREEKNDMLRFLQALANMFWQEVGDLTFTCWTKAGRL